MPGTADSEPPSVSLSFANNFWGKDDAGVGPMLERMHNAKVTSDELKSFYAARAAIEDEYSRKLLNLSRKPLGSSESGTLRLSLDVIRAELESMGKAHQHIAGQMKTELEEPLAAFAGGMKERRKIVQNGIEKLLKIKTQQTIAVNKARDRYETDCLKIKGFLAQAHMVMGQEERKNKAKLEKTQIQLSTTSSEYEAAVKILEETTGRWNRDWKAACDKFQDLEEERIDYMKSSLWTFANIASTVCVSDDAACEKIRLSLEDCDVEKDITTFIKDNSTGQEIPDPPKFINFCRGDTTSDNGSDTSDEGNYSVAQFQRTMNPAFRSSSPQPSVFESHHDPNNPLAKELGLKDTRPIPIQEPIQPPVQPSFEDHQPQMMQPTRRAHPEERLMDSPSQVAPPARGSQPDPRRTDRQYQAMPPPRQPDPQSLSQHSHPAQSSRGIQPDPRLIQAQQQAQQQQQQKPVPLNEYPMDGMTQFCRIGPPSQRNSMPAPVRPSSRDSNDHSDYSNPNSFSSIEPPSGSASPGKPLAQSPQPLDEDKQVQKKKSGFFQNHSPFGRRGKQEKVEPTAVAKPNNRNTWGPVSKRNTNETAIPTRPFSKGSGGGILGGEARSASPEPVDPRANFQLNIGNNVFDVASPDGRKKDSTPKAEQEELDPIAQALAELKGVTKQTSLRVSADRFHGLATPIPGTPAPPAAPAGGVPTPMANGALNAAQRGTPPPSYDQPPVSRLGAPKPAFTSRQMQQTTQRYLDQKTSMFNTGPPAARPAASSRPSTRGAPQPQEAPRAVSPAPPRSKSPRPGLYSSSSQPPPPQTQPQPAAAPNRAVSPNPYAASNAGSRPRALSTSPVKQYGSDGARGSVPNTGTRGSVANAAGRDTASNAGARPQASNAGGRDSFSNAGARPATSNIGGRPPTANTGVRPPPANTAGRTPTANTGGRPPTANAGGRDSFSNAARPMSTAGGRGSISSTHGGSPAYGAIPRAASPNPAATPTRAASRAAGSTGAASPAPQFRQQSYDQRPASRAVSPAPQFRPSQSYDRPASSRAASPAPPQFQPSYDRPSNSRGSDMRSEMALQLAPGPGSERGEGSVYGGSQRGGSGRPGTSSGRPMSQYAGSDAGGPNSADARARSQSQSQSHSLAEPRVYTNSGRIILHYARAMYMYSAQIPEELSFAKGDILAVLRMQDDGWWEAEVVGKNARPGLVPSNYLQNC